MAIQYVCAFSILVTEVVLFALISLPLPSKYRAPLLKALSKPFNSESVQIGIKCVFVFIGILFFDSVQRVRKVGDELTIRDGGLLDNHLSNAIGGAVSRAEIKSRRFYAQRNMYLTGFCLFLSFVVYRTYSLVFELLEVKEKIRTLESSGKAGTASTVDKEDLLEQIKQVEEEKEAILLKSKALNDEL